MRPEDLARAVKELVEWAHTHAPAPEPEVRRRLRDHFGVEPVDLPVVARGLASWDRPNVQVALDAWTAARNVELVGLPVMQGYRAGIAELVRGSEWLANIRLGAVEHVTVPLGEHDSITCVKSGLWLVRDADAPLVLMLKSEDLGPGENLTLEVMATERNRADAVLSEIWALMAERNVYRGRVLELSARHFHEDEGAPLTVRSLPQIKRDRIILPAGVLERIERQAFGIARHAERLRASGRHLRRGLLLHGPPGTGKTLTAMYLAAEMPERTVVLLTGQSLHAVGMSVDLATALQPAMVVLEDVRRSSSLSPTPTVAGGFLRFTVRSSTSRWMATGSWPSSKARARHSSASCSAGGALLAAEESEGPLRVAERHLTGALDELRQGGEILTNTLLGAHPERAAVPTEDE